MLECVCDLEMCLKTLRWKAKQKDSSSKLVLKKVRLEMMVFENSIDMWRNQDFTACRDQPVWGLLNNKVSNRKRPALKAKSGRVGKLNNLRSMEPPILSDDNKWLLDWGRGSSRGLYRNSKMPKMVRVRKGIPYCIFLAPSAVAQWL